MSASDGTSPIKQARRDGKAGCLFSLLCLFLILVPIGATVAVADEPKNQPPGPPTAVEMQEGLNADNSAVYETELTDLQAAEELPHQDLNRTQALDLLVGVFDPLLQAPAGVFDDLDVERFLSANAAIIAPGNQPEPHGITIGEPPQDRYEGATLLESTIPLRDEGEAGKTEVVDLALEPGGNGTIAPSNPLVEVSLPQQLGDGIELPEAGITVELEDAPGALSPSTLDQGVAAYPEVAEDTTLAVAPAPGGFETFTLLQSPDAPTSQTFTLDLPAGASLQPTREGGAEVVRSGEPIMGVSPPAALDAAGEDVPASMTVSGNALTLDVSPQASTEFPVLLDPLYETYNWWNGITGLGGWAGTTNASPNYYFADKATCTTYASPYACQSGLTSNAPGLYLGALPGAVPVNSSVNWEFRVPRWQEEWTNNNRPPDSFISYMVFGGVGFWHRTDGAPNPTLWSGIWNSNEPGWVAGYSAGGNYPDFSGGTYNYNPGQNPNGKQASFAMSNLDGHNLTAFRDAFLNTATITIADTKAPTTGSALGPPAWVNQVPSEPITATFSDFGLGVYRLTVIPDGIAPPQWPTHTLSCTGTTVYPCMGTKTFQLSRHFQGETEVRHYDPSVLPQGINKVNLYAEDPLGNKSGAAKVEVKIDHTAPRIAPLSGTLTEQAKIGTNASQYTLKYSAVDGDHAAAAALTPFGGSGSTDGKFNRPQGVAIDSSGNIWVVDKNNNRVQKFDETGKFLLQFGGLGSADGKFNDPRGIAVSSNGTVWVSDIGNKRVQAFDSQGAFIRKITTEMNMPYGLATGPGGVLWVADPGTARINKYSESGSYLGKAYGSAANPTGGSDLNYPVGLATDAAGNVWAIDSGNSSIKKYNSSGKYISQLGTTGTGPGQLQTPLYIAVAPSGHLLVTEELTNRVQVFQSNGVYLRQFGSAGTGDSQFNEVRGVAINADNTAFVVDPGNHRVTKWSHADLDRQSGVASTEVKVDGNLVEPKYAPGCATEDCSITREWTLKAQDFTSGQHDVEVTATDGVGLSTTKSLSVTTVRDETPPQLTANNQFYTAPEGWLQQKSYMYGALASDVGGKGVTSVKLTIDGSVVKSMTQSCPNGGCAGFIYGSIDIASYKGGAHPAELVAIDAVGNTTKKAWTINVNPSGDIPAAEAVETLEAVDNTADLDVVAPTSAVLEPEQIELGDNPGLEQNGSQIESTGVTTTTTMTLDPADGIEIESPKGVTEITPIVEGSTTNADIAADVAAVSANAESEIDTVVRPQFNGIATFAAIRDIGADSEFSWDVQLSSTQSLTIADEDGQFAEIRYSDGETAFLITNEGARDATGKLVPSRFSVSGNTLTLHVSHSEGSYTYPVTAGQTWETGYESVSFTLPDVDDGIPDEGPPSGPPPYDPRNTPFYWLKSQYGDEKTYQPPPEYYGPSNSVVAIWGVHSCALGGCDKWETWLSGSYLRTQYIKQSWNIQRWYKPDLKCAIDMERGFANFPYALAWKVDAYEWFGPEIVTKGEGKHLGAWCHYRIQSYPGGTEYEGATHCLALQGWIWPNGWVYEFRRRWDPPVGCNGVL
jgi:hypothetical protein